MWKSCQKAHSRTSILSLVSKSEGSQRLLQTVKILRTQLNLAHRLWPKIGYKLRRGFLKKMKNKWRKTWIIFVSIVRSQILSGFRSTTAFLFASTALDSTEAMGFKLVSLGVYKWTKSINCILTCSSTAATENSWSSFTSTTFKTQTLTATQNS